MWETTNTRQARKNLHRVLSRVRIGTISVTWSDGTHTQYGLSDDELSPGFVIHDETMLWRGLLDQGSLGLGATYLDGAWDSDDLAAFLTTASRNIDARQNSAAGRAVFRTVRRWWDSRPAWIRPSPIGEIGDHYDLGNEFYASWLDETMSYSSALFSSQDEHLEQAQARKYQRLCEMLDLQPGDRVLEIGCGWGGFAEFAALAYDAHVTGLTLSSEMARYARKRLAQAGVGDKTDIVVKDFRLETGKYDKVVSIEMIESISAAEWPDLFSTIGSALRPGGKAAMQVITIDDRYYESLVKRKEYIKTYIFPGGDLPSMRVLNELARSVNLMWASHTRHGRDYAETLARWARRFEQAWDAIEAKDPAFDRRFRRMWKFYLAYCEAGFQVGRLDGVQILLEAPATVTA